MGRQEWTKCCQLEMDPAPLRESFVTSKVNVTEGSTIIKVRFDRLGCVLEQINIFEIRQDHDIQAALVRRKSLVEQHGVRWVCAKLQTSAGLKKENSVASCKIDGCAQISQHEKE